MKKILFFTVFIIFCHSCATDDTFIPVPLSVYQGNLILRTQADVDAIGMQGFQVINGYLNIGDRATDNHMPVPSDITDLSPLNSLLQVTRQLEVQSNPMLTSLDGLENLSSVAGIVINQNENLVSLDGLEGLKTITNVPFFTGQVTYQGGVISLFDNASLTSISALGTMEPQVLNRVSIRNSQLTTLEGLQTITGISNLNIVDNDVLSSLEALENLSFVSSSILIAGNADLTNYCILQNPLQNNPDLPVFNVLDNQFNPTQQNIIDGNCSQ